ncbi:hypothetical protein SynBIOSE41_02755 [Synechococcus sp. BIOS-E4-1]|nr:hypothetical protein SynBIOSE41_02755 [Synechococcus sp. BIOS-E4-1]
MQPELHGQDQGIPTKGPNQVIVETGEAGARVSLLLESAKAEYRPS